MAVTVKDIANAVGYAPSTICNVLNNQPRCGVPEETRQKIREAAARLGYTPNFFARGLRRKRSYLVGVVGELFNYEALCQQVRGIVGPLLKQGYQTYFADTGHERAYEVEVVRSLCHRMVEGMILVWPQDPVQIRQIVPKTVPCVLLSDGPSPGYSCVILDRVGGMRKAVRALYDLGHRRIGLVMNNYETNALKTQGYRLEMKELGLLDERLFFKVPEQPGAVVRHVESNADDFRSVTAVLATDDHYAIETMTGLARIGLRVPQDCSVVGFDDIELATGVNPTLTTLRQPRGEISELLVRLFEEARDGAAPRDVILMPELILRGSTGPCAGANRA